MKHFLPLLLCLALVVLGAAPGAFAEAAYTGQSLEVFMNQYSEDVYFINDNTGYHLMPLIISKQGSGADDGRVVFSLKSDQLTVFGTTGRDGSTIDRCAITLTAPADMTVGDAVYNDFVLSAYHCYALLMAMEGSAQPAERYAVVDLIEQAIADGGGTGAVQRGVYALTGEKTDTTVVLTFENTRAIPDETKPPADDAPADATPAPDEGSDGDEGAGLL